MSNPAWPSTIRRPDRGTWRETPQPVDRRFTPKVGGDIVSRAATAGAALVQFRLTLPLAQFATLRTFYHTTLSEGVLLFDMTHAVLGGTLTYQFARPYDWIDKVPDVVVVSIALIRQP